MAKNLNKWLDEFVKNGADANNVVGWPENAGGKEIIIVDELPETGKEGDLVVLKNANSKIVLSSGPMYYIEGGDPTNVENAARKQLSISEDVNCTINIDPVNNIDNIEEDAILKINSAEDLIGHPYRDLLRAYLSIEDLKIENYTLNYYTDANTSMIDLTSTEFEGILTKGVILGDKLYFYSRRSETDENRIITGFTDWELVYEFSIIRFENKDEFIDFSDPSNKHIIDENNELYGEDKWIYLGEFSKPIYAESTYALYAYNDGKWNPVNSDSSNSSKTYSPACYRYGALKRAYIMFNPEYNYKIDTDALIVFLTDGVMESVPFEPHEDGSEQYRIEYFSNSSYYFNVYLSRRSSTYSASLYISIGSPSSEDKITLTISDLINETGDTISSFLNRNKQAIDEALQNYAWTGLEIVSILTGYSYNLQENFCNITIPTTLSYNLDNCEFANASKFLDIFVKSN